MTRWIMLVLLFGTATVTATAQVPAGATGLCKDGTYSNAPKKSGACSGHKGVQTWYATAGTASASTPPAAKQAQAAVPPPSPAAAAPSTPAKSPQQSSPSASSISRSASQPQAAGGGPGMVWVNTSSKTYHCQGTAYYGKTKQGKYLSEADAKAEGDHADHGKLCAK